VAPLRGHHVVPDGVPEGFSGDFYVGNHGEIDQLDAGYHFFHPLSRVQAIQDGSGDVTTITSGFKTNRLPRSRSTRRSVEG
jgi:hypothetical protein